LKKVKLENPVNIGVLEPTIVFKRNNSFFNLKFFKKRCKRCRLNLLNAKKRFLSVFFFFF